MKYQKADRKSNRLIIIYGIVAVLFIVCFQIYWLCSLYNNQEKLIVEEAQNKVTEYKLSMEGMELMKNLRKHVKVENHLPINGFARDSVAVSNMKVEIYQSEDGADMPIQINILDSLFSFEAQKKTFKKIHNEAVADLKKALPGIRFKLYNKKISADKGKILESESKLNPKKGATLVLYNLSYIVLKKIWVYIALSIVYLLVCISAVILLINSIRRGRRLMEQKVSFTNNMTHELKTPIATLYAATEALDKYNVLEDKKTAREYVKLMQADLKRLKNMADSILHNAKLSDGKLQIHIEKLNLGDLLDDVVSYLKPRLEDNEANIVINIPEDLIVRVDGDQMLRVFTNLIDNSLKYANAIPKITIGVTREDRVIRIIVTDNGIGIPYKYHKDIFKPYFRVSEGNRHTFKGYGLGLSYVKEVIKLHGGTITLVKDDQLKGTAFEIIIPSYDE